MERECSHVGRPSRSLLQQSNHLLISSFACKAQGRLLVLILQIRVRAMGQEHGGDVRFRIKRGPMKGGKLPSITRSHVSAVGEEHFGDFGVAASRRQVQRRIARLRFVLRSGSSVETAWPGRRRMAGKPAARSCSFLSSKAIGPHPRVLQTRPPGCPPEPRRPATRDRPSRRNRCTWPTGSASAPSGP